jgi:3',5'-cyclic AMP phosphodiesterase CpdA
MPRIIHLSDLHFGAHDPELVDAVEEQVNAGKPDLVVISGDLTQRATTDQLKEACRFLERLREAGHDVLAVPGNHDVPLYDVLRRFLSPLARYRRYIDDTLCPFIEIPGVSVLGINTARSLTFSDGRISHEQMDFIRESFARTDPTTMHILVTHHPMFALPVDDGPELGKAIGRQEHALDAIAEAGVDMLLAGHNHRASTHDASDLVTRAGSALVIQAGTATSVRLRGEEQSFNRIQIDVDDVAVTELSWNGEEFIPGEPAAYRRSSDAWTRASAAKAAELSDSSA